MKFLKYCCIVIIDKTQDEWKKVFLFSGYGKPEGAGADARDIAEHWEKISQEFDMPPELDVIANDFLHRITACYDKQYRRWVFSNAYTFRSGFDIKSDYIYVISLFKDKDPYYIQFDAYEIPDSLKENIQSWEDICTDDNRVEVPKENRRKTEPIWNNPNLKYKPKEE